MNAMMPAAAPQPAIEDSQALARIKAILSSPNLAQDIDANTLKSLGKDVVDKLKLDEGSMGKWHKRMKEALKLAQLLEKKGKDYPFKNASNVNYPLITSAALQYNARAYPALVPSTDVVKVAVFGADKDNAKATRAQRVSDYMSWQLKMDSPEWERTTDQLTMQLPIVGDVFRKIWYDPARDKCRFRLRLPGEHIIVNNNAPCLEEAPRVSDKITMYPHEIETSMRTGRFIEFEYPKTGRDEHEPEEFIEQMCRHDLDEDGYPEPYIVTVHKDTQQVVRIVAAYDLDTVQIGQGQIASADPDAYFVHYNFWPSMDGGLLGMGIGILLADIAETVNSTLNMIIDAGHLSSLGAGFIGTQNFRVKGGVKTMKPGEYQMVNFTGDDIRKGIVPLDFPEPSNVLFQVLGMMIDAGREMASVSDVMTGDVQRQNMMPGTIHALIEQGMMVFTASYRRMYRAMQSEFAMIAKMNQKYLSPIKYNRFLDGEQPQDPSRDFDLGDMDLQPVADPKSVTSMQKMSRAQFLLELAGSGLIDPAEATKRVLDAASVEDAEALMPKPDPMAKVMAAAQEELMVIEIKTKEAELDEIIAKTMANLAKAEKDMAEADLMPLRQKIDEFKAMKETLIARREAIDPGRLGGVAGTSGDAPSSGGSQGGGASQLASVAG